MCPTYRKVRLIQPTYPTYPINLTWNQIQIQPNQLYVSDLSRIPTYPQSDLPRVDCIYINDSDVNRHDVYIHWQAICVITIGDSSGRKYRGAIEAIVKYGSITVCWLDYYRGRGMTDTEPERRCHHIPTRRTQLPPRARALSLSQERRPPRWRHY